MKIHGFASLSLDKFAFIVCNRTKLLKNFLLGAEPTTLKPVGIYLVKFKITVNLKIFGKISLGVG